MRGGVVILRGAGAFLVILAVCYVVGAAVQQVAKARDWDPDGPKVYTGFVALAFTAMFLVILYLLGMAVSSVGRS